MKRLGLGEVLLAAAAVGWMAALVFGSGWLFPAGAFICHQRPDRSFFVNSGQMAVCARCTGLYAGAAVAAPLALLVTAASTASAARRAVLIAALPTAATWTLEFTGLMHFSNGARFFAGLPLGFVAAWFVFQTLKAEPLPERERRD